jgi:hypothetical protein
VRPANIIFKISFNVIHVSQWAELVLKQTGRVLGFTLSVCKAYQQETWAILVCVKMARLREMNPDLLHAKRVRPKEVLLMRCKLAAVLICLVPECNHD